MKKEIEKVKEKAKQVEVSPIQIDEFTLNVVGTTPMLQEKMSEEVAQEMIDKMEGKGKDKKKIRDFGAEVEKKIHRTEDGKVGFPASGFKKAIVEASPYMEGMDKKLARSIIIVGNLVPIQYKKQVINKTMGKDSGIKKSPRPIWRPEFQDWSCKLLVRYNKSLITADQIVGLVKLAGFHIGVGGWTPQHSGSYGMFTIA